MEKRIMYTIYNSLFDAKHELGIEDLEIYLDLEQGYVVKYKYDGETYIINNNFLNI